MSNSLLIPILQRSYRALSILALMGVLSCPESLSQLLPVEFELASPNAQTNSYFGFDTATLGDVNADGYADILVSGRSETVGGFSQAGRAYVYSGENGSVLYSLVSPNPETTGIFGESAEDAGDVDGDGVTDLIVGAMFEDGAGVHDAGRAYVFSGATGALIHTLESPNPSSSGAFGRSVAGIGDVNADGHRDVAVGAYGEDVVGTDAGRAYVFSGATGTLLYTLTPSVIQSFGYYGTHLAAAGDVNGDGTPDVIVGAYEQTVNGLSRAGRAFVHSGLDGSVLYTLTSPNSEYFGDFGVAVAGPGDLNGDGFAEVFVGADFEDGGGANAGRAYVFSGQTGSVLYTLVSPNAAANGYFGRSVSGAGDVDADGVPDLLVGAWGEPNGAMSGAGQAYIFSGATGALLYTLASSNPEAGGAYGFAVSGGADVNSDGYPDVLIGARAEASGSTGDAGSAYVYTSVVANAGANISEECAGPPGTTVTFDGTGSSQSVGGISYVWTNADGVLVSSDAAPTLSLELGTYTYTLTITAQGGATDSDEVVVTVADTTPPVLTLATERLSLWPPNGKLRRYTAADFGLIVTDACAGDLTNQAFLERVWSDEPEDALGNGDGRTRRDIRIDAACGSVRLRAERQKRFVFNGNGRVYTLVFSATDASGNSASIEAQVEVRRLRFRASVNDGAEAGYTVEGCSGAPIVVAPEAIAEVVATPMEVAVTAYPNPFMPATTLRYGLATDARVDLRVYDVTGRVVAVLVGEHQSAGMHAVAFDGSQFASGVYVARLQAGERVELVKLTRLR